MIRIALLALAIFSAAPAAIAGHGLVTLPSGRKVFTDYRPAQGGRPTLVLLSGLTYNLDHWNTYVDRLVALDPKVGILRFDMIGMGRTLLEGPLPVDYAIPYHHQVELTRQLMDHFRIRKAFLAGLSYGGAIAVAFGAAHPNRVEQLILMAPFTEPLQGMDTWIKGQIAATRITFPLNPATDDELYDFFLRQFVFTSYPPLEPSVLENPYKLEAVFRMVQGIRKYDTLRDAGRLPRLSTHLLVARQDQYIQVDVLDRFWKHVPRSARASRIDISVSHHKIPETIPTFAAAWTHEILSRRPELSRGLEFEGSTMLHEARTEGFKIPLKR